MRTREEVVNNIMELLGHTGWDLFHEFDSDDMMSIKEELLKTLDQLEEKVCVWSMSHYGHANISCEKELGKHWVPCDFKIYKFKFCPFCRKEIKVE